MLISIDLAINLPLNKHVYFLGDLYHRVYLYQILILSNNQQLLRDLEVIKNFRFQVREDQIIYLNLNVLFFLIHIFVEKIFFVIPSV